ncbi:hypothetical protein [Bradyrhizobium sp.]|uniref:hypothetical protein n=1 Tax=Bradyrhizobium sp. TaxID=376 RepID=UPI00345DD6A1
MRIRSDRKWPERVVFDTSAPIVAPAEIAKPALVAAANSDVSAKSSHVREAFAQLPQQGGPASNPKVSQTAQAKLAEHPVRPQAKRRVAKAHANRPVMLVAQQPHGFFDTW